MESETARERIVCSQMRELVADYAKHPLQVALCILGISLGVCVAVAIDIANRSAVESMRENIETISGRATHQVLPTGGLDIPEKMLPDFSKIAGVTAAAPIIEQIVDFEETPGK